DQLDREGPRDGAGGKPPQRGWVVGRSQTPLDMLPGLVAARRSFQIQERANVISVEVRPLQGRDLDNPDAKVDLVGSQCAFEAPSHSLLEPRGWPGLPLGAGEGLLISLAGGFPGCGGALLAPGELCLSLEELLDEGTLCPAHLVVS